MDGWDLALTGWGRCESGINDLRVGVVDGDVGTRSTWSARFHQGMRTYPEGVTAVLILTPRNWKVLADCIVGDVPIKAEVLEGDASSLIACAPALALRVTPPEEAGPDWS